MKRFAVLASVLAACTLLAAQARALSAETVLMPLRDRILLCEAGLSELDRQAALLQQQMKATAAWRVRLKQALLLNVNLLTIDQQRRQAIADLGAARVQPLTALNHDQGLVPHLGWGDPASYGDRRSAVAAAIAEENAALARGETQFLLPGQGWVTGAGLDSIIAADAERMAAFQAQLDAGDWHIVFPGLGHISRTGLENCARDAVEKYEATRAQIEAGAFRVNMPGLGWVTAKSLTDQIAALETQLDGVRGSLGSTEFFIQRADKGRFNAPTLSNEIAANATAGKTLRDAIGAQTWHHHMPALGRVSASMLRDAIAAEMDAIAQVEAAAAAGDYPVPANTTRTQATERLSLPNCRQNGPNPCLPAEQRPALQDVLRRIPIAVQTDVDMRKLSLTRLKEFLAALPELAASELDRLAMVGANLDLLSPEFDRELVQYEQQLTGKIAYLRAVLDDMP